MPDTYYMEGLLGGIIDPWSEGGFCGGMELGIDGPDEPIELLFPPPLFMPPFFIQK